MFCFGGKKGFTLIELLVVTMVIGVLAAIAVPNMLGARTKAKVARAKADLHHIAIGLESYFVDNSAFPNDCEGLWHWRVTRQLTTPIRYITGKVMVDNFMEKTGYPEIGCRHRYVNYEANIDTSRGQDWGVLAVSLRPAGSRTVVPEEWCQDGMAVFGKWKICSAGPDLTLTNVGFIEYDLVYDPTNGTTSDGDIIRCQLGPFPKVH